MVNGHAYPSPLAASLDPKDASLEDIQDQLQMNH
jgi:hypothetical protein